MRRRTKPFANKKAFFGYFLSLNKKLPAPEGSGSSCLELLTFLNEEKQETAFTPFGSGAHPVRPQGFGGFLSFLFLNLSVGLTI
jgi:hypothetical protein